MMSRIKGGPAIRWAVSIERRGAAARQKTENSLPANGQNGMRVGNQMGSILTVAADEERHSTKMKKLQYKIELSFVALVMALLAFPASAAELPAHPPDPDGKRADAQGIHNLVDYLKQAGVGGLWLLGSAGEDINLSRKVRLETIRHTAAANQGELPLVTGTGCTSLEEILEMRHASYRTVHDFQFFADDE